MSTVLSSRVPELIASSLNSKHHYASKWFDGKHHQWYMRFHIETRLKIIAMSVIAQRKTMNSICPGIYSYWLELYVELFPLTVYVQNANEIIEDDVRRQGSSPPSDLWRSGGGSNQSLRGFRLSCAKVDPPVACSSSGGIQPRERNSWLWHIPTLLVPPIPAISRGQTFRYRV